MPKQPRPALSETWRLAGTRSKRAPVATLEGPPSNGFAVTALACRVGSSNERWFHNQVTRGKRHNARTLALRALRGAETRRHGDTPSLAQSRAPLKRANVTVFPLQVLQ